LNRFFLSTSPIAWRGCCSIDDPAEAPAWIGRRQKAMEAWDAEESQPDDDPAQTIRLTETEIGWLSGFSPNSEGPY
jgi:hypothetical protein